MYNLSLAHFYPNQLNLYGDIGNIFVLKKRCEWRNISISIQNIEMGENFNPEIFDICFIGSGQDFQQIKIAKELKRHKKALDDCAKNNTVFLATEGGYQLLGEYFETQNGEQIEGTNLLDVYTVKGNCRFTGNVTAKCNFVTPTELVGFENHNTLTYLKSGTQPLATTIIGKGNNGEDNTEGARKNNVFGTYLHGALLPKNPHFADYLIELALEKKYGEKIKLPKLNDEIELDTHKSLIRKKY